MIRILASFAIALCALASASGAHAQPWPAQPVKMIVPFSPGTGMDILARTVGPKLAAMWGQPVVVENRPGASGNLGGHQAAIAKPDGYTLVMASSTLIINTTLYKDMQYNPLTEDGAVDHPSHQRRPEDRACHAGRARGACAPGHGSPGEHA